MLKVLFPMFLVPLLLPAVPTTFTASSGSRAATAMFDTSGTNLVVTLKNTSNSDAMVPTDILTAVFFKITGSNPTLGRVSAILDTGSVVNGSNGTGAGNSVGGEWSYLGGISAHGANRGISSSGLGIFGPGNVFPGSGNLEGPASPNGVEYGITSAGDNSSTGNGGIRNAGLIKNSVIFTLSGLGAGFNPEGAISNVVFQYGTNLSEPSLAGTALVTAPEPASVLFFGTIAGLVCFRLRRKFTA